MAKNQATKKEVQNGFSDNESPWENNPELDQERTLIESLKAREQAAVITPNEFKASAQRVAKRRQVGVKDDVFSFKAGRDPLTKKRWFNVRGFADPKHIYRGATANVGETTYHFFSDNYDKLYLQNSDRIITVNGWVKRNNEWELSPVAKNELGRVETIPTNKALTIYEEIRKQGKNPGA